MQEEQHGDARIDGNNDRAIEKRQGRNVTEGKFKIGGGTTAIAIKRWKYWDRRNMIPRRIAK